MIKIIKTNEAIAVKFEGTEKEVRQDIWAILEAYRENLGTYNTLKYLEGYLIYIQNEIKGEK